jgi:hypothetical protein
MHMIEINNCPNMLFIHWAAFLKKIGLWNLPEMFNLQLASVAETYVVNIFIRNRQYKLTIPFILHFQ